MSRVLLYYAHPGHIYSRANKALFEAAKTVPGISCVDLYAEYPRFDINIDREQERLLAHDIYVFQHPLFWYSVPALIKEWIDLVLEHGFAYGADGHKLTGKIVMQAITAAGGPDQRAKLSKVHILRQLADGRQERIKVDVKAIQRGRKSDVPLERNDTVVVGEWFF